MSMFIVRAAVLAIACSAAMPRFAHAQICDLTGTWAAMYTIPLQWRFNAGLEGGSGNYVVRALVHRERAGPASYRDILQLCSKDMPATRALSLYGGERYQPAYPAELFSAAQMPPAQADLAVAAPTTQVGAPFACSPAAFLLGLAAQDPLGAPFPRRMADAVAQAMGPDPEGRMGLRVPAAAGAGLSLPPVNAMRSKRAVFFDLVGRDVLSSRGHVQSCDLLTGTAQVAQLDGKVGLQATLIGCRLSDGQDCSRGDLGLVNAFQPNFMPSDGQVRMLRLAPGAGCPDVRQALPF